MNLRCQIVNGIIICGFLLLQASHSPTVETTLAYTHHYLQNIIHPLKSSIIYYFYDNDQCLVHYRLLPCQTSTDCFQNAQCRQYYFSIRSHWNRNFYHIGILCIWFSILESIIHLQRIMEYFYQYILNIKNAF